jgi:hypothetical protein
MTESAGEAESPARAGGIRLLIDEDFNNDILRGVLRRLPGVDAVRAQDVGLSGRPDPDLLAWAADHGRVLLTHDVSTMTTHAYERVARSLPMPGVFAVAQTVPISVAIEQVVMIAECSLDGEWEGQVRHLPL